MNDPDLQRRFAALREQEAKHVASFDRLWAAAARAQLEKVPALPWAVRLTLAGSVAALLLGGYWMSSVDSDSPRSRWDTQLASLESEIAALELTTWQAPSDFLLTANP